MIKRRIKVIAIFLNMLFVHHIVAPTYLYALTGGPGSPEFTGFTPAGASELVNLFTGDFSYNIPLMDVGGYPINLAYNAGVTMEQEASWVGLGWNINPGAINRQVRGLPDDFSGDEITRQYALKNVHSFGVKAKPKFEFVGFGDRAKEFEEMDELEDVNQENAISKANLELEQAGLEVLEELGYALTEKQQKRLKIIKILLEGTQAFLDGSDELINEYNIADMKKRVYPHLGFSYNNYKGVGLEVGVSLQSMVKKKVDQGWGHNASLDLNFGTQNGIGLNMAYSAMSTIEKEKNGVCMQGVRSFGGAFSANSRNGIENIGFDQSRQMRGDYEAVKGHSNYGGYGLNYSFSNPTSSIPNFPMTNLSFLAGFEPGGEIFFGKAQMDFEGYYAGQYTRADEYSYGAYGYLYLENHVNATGYEKGSEQYLLDFNREGDKPLSRDVPNLPLPVIAYDMYYASGQGMSLGFRAHRYDNGTVHDPNVRTNSYSGSLEYDAGTGKDVDWGADIGLVLASANKGKWPTNAVTDEFTFKSAEQLGSAYSKPYYFKASSDFSYIDAGYYSNMGEDGLMAPEIKASAGMFIQPESHLRKGDATTVTIGNDVSMNTSRPNMQHNIVGLTAQEASAYGLQREIEYYDTDDNLLTTSRRGDEDGLGYEKKNEHISEFHVTKPDGSMYVYGLPVYNKVHKEVSFSLDPGDTYNCGDKLVDYSGFGEDVTVPGHKHGFDRYFNAQVTPAHTTAHLITGILSPDYEDLTGDGISDDDHGSAVKFNYTKQTFGESEFYKYRTPYEHNRAKVNEALKSDDFDNKASYSYGEKEVYYLHTIESKNFIAKFVLNDPLNKRLDGIGVADEDGGQGTDQRLRRLERIELYSKEDLAKNAGASPIKTVHFAYEYTLCTGIPNGETGPGVGEDGGKLTLTKVWFTYGTSTRGSLSSYQFDYDNTYNHSYEHNASDAWGNYQAKVSDCTSLTQFPNDQFPYTTSAWDTQDDHPVADDYAAAWNLSEIILPSGGKIEVTYEADDYSHVQDQNALRMFSIVDTRYDPAIAGSGSTGKCRLFEHSGDNKHSYTYLVFDLEDDLDGTVYSDPDDAAARIEQLYGRIGKGQDGEALEKLFFQCEVYINSDHRDDNDPADKNWLWDKREIVSGYANVEGWGALKSDPQGNNYDQGYVKIADVDLNGDRINGNNDKVNPISYESWNYFRKHLNKYVNPVSEPKTADVANYQSFGASMQVFRHLINNFGRELRRMFQGVNRMMRGLHYAEDIVAGRSMIRLSEPDGIKPGGGHRVSKIRIKDKWKDLTGGVNHKLNGEYGQDYEYHTYDKETGMLVSSGVASNEPMLGWEQCALKHFDEVWEQKKVLATNSYEFFERPYGYSFLPGAAVGYSRVGVSAYNPTADPNEGEQGFGYIDKTATGKTVHEYYTTKDHPTITRESEIDQEQSRPFSPSHKMFSYSNNVLGLAQGYLVITNDMNGRPKEQHTYSEGAAEWDDYGNKIDGMNYTRYHYSQGSVNTLNSLGVNTVVYDVDVDFVLESTAARSQTATPHVQLQAEVSTPLIGGFIVPSGSYTKEEVRYVVSTKHVHKRGSLYKVETSERGIKNTAINKSFDPVSGGVMVNQTFNEFNDPVYSSNIPGHWAYDQLNIESPRQGLIFDKISWDATHNVQQNLSAITGLKNGDKVILKAAKNDDPMGHKVTDVPLTGMTEPVFWYLEGKLIDRIGDVLTKTEAEGKVGTNAYLIIIDPAENNMAGSSIGSIATLLQPAFNGTVIHPDALVLSASAVEYKDRWRTHCCGFQKPFDIDAFAYCGDGPCDVVNPFVKGVLGKMRPFKTHAVYGERTSTYTTANSDIDVRFDGDISGFQLFWTHVSNGQWEAAASPALWTWTSEITEYDEKGMQIESTNKLDQRSSTLTGYDNMVTVAAAQNAGYGEMAFDGFEDYNYKRVGYTSPYTQMFDQHDKCFYDPHFGFINPGIDYFEHTSDDYAHTGLKSLKVDAPSGGGVNAISMSYETSDANNQATLAAPFTLDKGDCFTKFYPDKEGEYTFSLWLREVAEDPDGYTSSDVDITFYDQANAVISQTNLMAEGTLIEGWQRVFGHFTIPATCEKVVFSFNARGTQASYFDDVRVFPKDGAMTSNVYHPHTLRLTASLDALNFASYYEYDAEGSLVRVKKETEEGIVTLQESRKHIIDNTP